MTAPAIHKLPPLDLRPATLADCVDMWRVSSSEVLSPFAYATLLRQLPAPCECLMACADDEVIGFVVAYRNGREVVLLDAQLASDELASRLFELLQAVASWPSFAGAKIIEADQACMPEAREAVAALRPRPRAMRKGYEEPQALAV